MPKILVSDSIDESGLAILRERAEVTFDPEIKPEPLVTAVGGYDALVVRSRTKVTAQVIGAGEQLRVIGRAGVGLDTIDVAAAKARGITVLNSPFAASVAVAELTLGLMLALARRIPLADAGLKRGDWLKKQLVGDELCGKTLAVVGIGNIGTAVVERARAFGMRAIAVDPYLTPDQIRQRGAEPVALDVALAEADYLTLHAPLASDTQGLLGREQLAKMKDGARLICAARGGLVDEDALADALDSGKLAGAGLDVFANEPPGLTRLVQHPQVIGTPHVGAMTREAQEKAAVDIARKVLDALQ